jgi:hypothetical protein
MHLAYSAISSINTTLQPSPNNQTDNELLLRYQAYQSTCHKYSNEIAAIQKYIPGWLPKFR